MSFIRVILSNNNELILNKNSITRLWKQTYYDKSEGYKMLADGRWEDITRDSYDNLSKILINN